MQQGEHSLLPHETRAACRNRCDRLRALLQERGIDALLITFPIEILYLTGFVGDESYALIGPENAWIISDPRYDEYLEPWRGASGFEVVMGVRHRLIDAVQALADRHGLKRLGVQPERMTIAERAKVAAALGEERVVDAGGVIPSLRMRKDADEIAHIERAAAFHQESIRAALSQLRLGMTETEFCARLECEIKSRSGSGASFPAIVAAGANSSIIHHTTGFTPIREGVLLVDWGAMSAGYCSDMTRTFSIGPVPPKIRAIYPIVLEAQLAALDACAPGKTCAEIDQVARDIISRAGYGEQFGHGLGHGLGLEVHEEPYFNHLSTDVVLEPGMVMTVEPGIYLPGVGGVRIEDDVLISDRGCRLLTDWPKDPDSMIVEPDAQTAGTNRQAERASSAAAGSWGIKHD